MSSFSPDDVAGAIFPIKVSDGFGVHPTIYTFADGSTKTIPAASDDDDPNDDDRAPKVPTHETHPA